MRDSGGKDEQALGSDPFLRSDGTIPYLTRLRERQVRLAGSSEEAPERTAAVPTRESVDLGPPVPEVPPFDDRDESVGWMDLLAGLLLDQEDEGRVAVLLEEFAGRPYDSLGLNPKVLRRTLGVFKQLYKYYFRVESSGHEFIPEKEAAILAGNHGGLMPFDGSMVITDIVLRAHPPRLVRAIVDRWAGTLPFVNVFFSRVGQVIGTRDNFRELLDRKQLVLTFPEGMAGARKLAAERYVLQRFGLGFIEESLRHRTMIIPVAIVGADDQAPILYDVKPLARLLGLPVFPITPTFPLLGPLGLLPYPVKYEIRYGEPFRFYEEFSPGALEDPQALRYMAEQVKGRIQEMVDAKVSARRGQGD